MDDYAPPTYKNDAMCMFCFWNVEIADSNEYYPFQLVDVIRGDDFVVYSSIVSKGWKRI